MQMISSEAGIRLAKARARLQALVASPELPRRERYIEAEREYLDASDAVADELVEQGFHEAEGA